MCTEEGKRTSSYFALHFRFPLFFNLVTIFEVPFRLCSPLHIARVNFSLRSCYIAGKLSDTNVPVQIPHQTPALADLPVNLSYGIPGVLDIGDKILDVLFELLYLVSAFNKETGPFVTNISSRCQRRVLQDTCSSIPLNDFIEVVKFVDVRVELLYGTLSLSNLCIKVDYSLLMLLLKHINRCLCLRNL